MAPSPRVRVNIKWVSDLKCLEIGLVYLSDADGVIVVEVSLYNSVWKICRRLFSDFAL